MKTTTDARRDVILWGALGCALIGTAHSEWSLAVAVGSNEYVAASVPGALDLYVLRALQQGRDVFVAVLAMVAANIAWYLVHSGDLPVGWELRSAVAAVAPLIVWRVHSLKYTRTRDELLWGTPPPARSTGTSTDAGAVSAPESTVLPCPKCARGAHPHPITAPCPDCECGDWAYSSAEYVGTYGYVPLRHAVLADECAPEYVPTEWTDSPVPYLRSVPEPEYVPDVVHLFPTRRSTDTEYVLTDADRAYLPGAQEYLDNCARTEDDPSVRGLMKALKVGQKRATTLLAHLAEESTP